MPRDETPMDAYEGRMAHEERLALRRSRWDGRLSSDIPSLHRSEVKVKVKVKNLFVLDFAEYWVCCSSCQVNKFFISKMPREKPLWVFTRGDWPMKGDWFCGEASS